MTKGIVTVELQLEAFRIVEGEVKTVASMEAVKAVGEEVTVVGEEVTVVRE